MKHLIFAAAMTAAMAAHADDNDQRQRVVADNQQDIYTQLCMAALESKYVLREKARELGVNRTRLRQLTCNGMSPREFRAEYGQEQVVTRAMNTPTSQQ